MADEAANYGTMRPRHYRKQTIVKNKGIEGLRGWAAMIVVFSHLVLTIWPSMANGVAHEARSRLDMLIFHSPLTIAYSGSFAVYVFFVMSGYVLSAKFFRTNDDQVIRDLFAKRYIRLMIPVLATTILTCLIVKSGGLIGPAERSLSPWFTSYNPSSDLTGAIQEGLWRSFVLGEANYNWVLWTMRVELLGSFLTFSICLLTKNLRHKWIIYSAISIAMLLTLGPSALYYIAFIVGIWTAGIPKINFHWMATLLLLFITVLFGGFIPGSISHEPVAGFSIIVNNVLIPRESICATIAGIAIFLATIGNKNVLNFFGKFPTLGQRSFAIYLIHLPVMGSLGALSFRLAKEYGGNYNAAGAIMVVVVVLSTYFFAGYYAKYIDQNSIRLAAYIFKKFNAPLSKPTMP